MLKKFLFCVIFFASPVFAYDDVHGNYNYSLELDNKVNCNDLEDPFEKVNRKIFLFNSFADHITLKPLAKAYNKYFSDFAKNRIGDFTQNIQEPLTTVNYTLQGRFDKTINSFWRFLINSIFGVAGTYDLSRDFDIKHEKQTFGSTLAYYGASPGPYVVLPLLGGTNMRDMWDILILNSSLNPLKYAMPNDTYSYYTVINMINGRADIMPFTEHVSRNSTDPYVAIRSAIHQRRESTLTYPSNYKCIRKLDY